MFFKASRIIESRFFLSKNGEKQRFIAASHRTEAVDSFSFHVLIPAERGAVGTVCVCVPCCDCV